MSSKTILGNYIWNKRAVSLYQYQVSQLTTVVSNSVASKPLIVRMKCSLTFQKTSTIDVDGTELFATNVKLMLPQVILSLCIIYRLLWMIKAIANNYNKLR